ncbi:Mss4-like protein [Pyrenochaeta sp. MPI-SDFR-AT-0127]|nr:Mss4-like protein [Pyrenochaeta sp. MPI-SDFR-AT-0127]
MSKPKPFPAITGSCVCSTVRYRLLTSPLFCYACHCTDCQKETGSAFGLFLSIESYNVSIISPTPPAVVIREKKPGVLSRYLACPKCKTDLWSEHGFGDGVCNLRVGTLDFPSLMEPDVHSYVDSKVEWLKLPEGARTTKKNFKTTELWPKSSLRRAEICKQRVAEAAKRKEAIKAAQQSGQVGAQGDEADTEEVGGEGEKTPTAVEFGEKEVEDDEAFEKRFKETERALQERLEKLTLKLEEEQAVQTTSTKADTLKEDTSNP